MATGSNNKRGPHRSAWIGTENNPEEDGVLSRLEKEPTLPKGVKYIAFQLEKGEEDTPHYQIYVELKCSQYISWLKENISARAHWEPRMGTREEASLYCTKDDTRIRGPWVIGEMSLGRGQRTDIVDFRDAIKSGKRKRDLWEEHPIMMCKYRHMYGDYRSCFMPSRNKELVVCLLVGTTGTGKTRTIHEDWKDREEGYWTMPIGSSSQWFDGYDRHERVLMDDFAGRMSKMPLTLLLWVLDIYPRYLPIKGGFTWWLPNYIAITSNYHPRKWYDWKQREESYKALARRIDKVVLFDRDMDGNPTTHLVEDKEAYFGQRFLNDELCTHDLCKLHDTCIFND